MHYYIKTMSGDIVYIAKEDAQKVARMIEEGKNISYKGKYIAHHQITEADYLGEYKGHEQLPSGDFDQAYKMLEAPVYTPSRRQEALAKIGETLKKSGANDSGKATYAATHRLAKRLHDTSEWHMKDWDEFIENHPNPIGELADLEIAE